MERFERQLHVMARRLQRARNKPPTFFRILFHWSSLPGMFGVGALMVLYFNYIDKVSNSALPSYLTVAAISFVFGAMVRDVGVARRVATTWPSQREFIDWDKVDAFVGRTAESREDRGDGSIE